MFRLTDVIKYRKFNNYYDGEDDNQDDNDPPSPPNEEKKEEKKEEEKKATKTFTQEELNKYLAEERRRATKANERTVQELEKLKKNQSLTEQEKQDLQERIETIKNENLTKEELAKKEQQKEARKRKEELDTITKEKERWKGLYETSTVDNTLLGAAAADPDVFNPNQILDLLKPKTRLVEELDEGGNPTGRFIPKVKLSGKNKDGENIVLELSASEAVKQLKENTTEYGNLFKSNVVRGVGGNNVGDQKKGGGPPEDPAAFREWRKKNPNYLQGV